MVKRSLCLLLALATVFSLAAPAFAEEAPITAEDPVVMDEPVEAAEEVVVEAEEPVEEPEETPVEETPAEEAVEEPAEEPEVTEEAPEAEAPAEEPEAEGPEAEPMPAAESGTYGEGVTWFLSDDGTLTVSGTGAMPAFLDFTLWDNLRKSFKKVVIENGVTGIGNWAFENCTSLTSVTLPSSVTYIEGSAFGNCPALTEVTILGNEMPVSDFDGPFPAQVTIKGYAFSMVHSYAVSHGYQFVPLDPETVKSGPCGNQTWTLTADGHFTLTGTGNMWDDVPWKEYNYAITEADIGAGITNIGGSAFSGCTLLTSVTIPNSVTSIGNWAFYGCTSLASVAIPDSVTSIGSRAFYNCASLTSVTLPDGVTSIGNSAFSGCSSLTSITIPDNVTSIGNSAFSGCSSLTSVTLPDSVTSIETNTFYNCKALTNVTIGAGVTTVRGYAFYNCKALTSVTIPDSVTYVGNHAFRGCTSLASATLGNGVTKIGESAFSGCTSLISVTIPESLTSIGSSAFYNCASLTSVTIPNGVTEIGNSMFNGCTSLANVTIKNPKCKMYDHQDTLGVYGGTTTIHGYDGSTAQTYAEKYGYPFESLGPVPTPVPTATPTPAPAKLATPKITKMENTASGLKVTWGKVSGAVRYTVFYKVKGAKSWTKIGTTTATSYTRATSKLTSGKTYVFTVRCVANDKKTYTSDYDKTGKSLTFYAPPTVKIAKVSTGIKVTWNKVSGSPRYMVYYKEGNGKWKQIGTTTATSYTRKASALKNNVTYYFTVRCCANDKKTMLSSYKASNGLKYKK